MYLKKYIVLIVYIIVFNGCIFSDFNKTESQLANKKDFFSYKKNNLLLESKQNTGTIISLSSNIFSQANIRKGFYQSFVNSDDIPFGLFFLKKYDPNKKIILFIHGISGSPIQFSDIINNINKNNFQVLVAFYPSGFRLEDLSNYLNNLLVKLQKKLKFQKVSIIAHSMGGLISKSIIDKQIKSSDLMIDTFISISTPWGGHKAANFGIKYTPIIIPVWYDMAQGSEFLHKVYKTTYPKNLNHYLIFGFKGKSFTAGGNSDGVVTINSQLRLIAQNNANIVKGYNENHTSILKNLNLINFINQILKTNNKLH